MKKSTIAIISVICTIAICVGVYFKICHVSKINDPKLEKGKYYICVLHFRGVNAFHGPNTYPVKNYVVAYNGKYENDFFECSDDGESIKIKLDTEEITIKSGTYTEKLKYTKNEVCRYSVPVTDVIETWEFIISDEPVQHELFYSGYEEGYDGVYYNIEDMEERDRRKKFIRG